MPGCPGSACEPLVLPQVAVPPSHPTHQADDPLPPLPHGPIASQIGTSPSSPRNTKHQVLTSARCLAIQRWLMASPLPSLTACSRRAAPPPERRGCECISCFLPSAHPLSACLYLFNPSPGLHHQPPGCRNSCPPSLLISIYLSIFLLSQIPACSLLCSSPLLGSPSRFFSPETRTPSHTRLRTDRELVTCKCKPAKSAGAVARETSIITPPLSPNFSYCLK